MIKVVMFDVGGVLHVSNTAVGDDLQQELGLSDDQTLHIFRHYIPLMGTSKITEQQMWDELHEQWGIRRVDSAEKLFARQFRPTLKKMPGMYELVEELKATGTTVMLLSNVIPQTAEVLEQMGHYDPFELRVLSYEVGIWKPDPAIYIHALQKANVKPEDAVFIDDQPKNTVAAEDLGIYGIVFQNTDQVKAELAKLMNDKN